MGVGLAEALQERMDLDHEREARQRGVAAKLLQLKEQARPELSEQQAKKLAKQAEEIIRAIPEEEPPSKGDEEPPIVLEQIPCAQSCVTSFGRYNQWGGDATSQTLGTWERLIIGPIPTTAPRTLHSRIAFVEAWGASTIRAVRGAGCWFTVARSGPARLDGVEFYFNAHNTVFGGAGYAEGVISFGGSVWGKHEGRWVGNTIIERSHTHYLGSETFRFDTNGHMVLSVSFEAIAGKPYYCAGSVLSHANVYSYGVPGAVGVEVAANLNPLMVCI